MNLPRAYVYSAGLDRAKTRRTLRSAETTRGIYSRVRPGVSSALSLPVGEPDYARETGQLAHHCKHEVSFLSYASRR